MVQKTMMAKLMKTLAPSHLEVINESHQHKVAPNSETHFKIIVVSNKFSEQNRVARHQTIYQLLASELAAGVHALALHAYSSQEWQSKTSEVHNSPTCQGVRKS